jgi:hypothetical protein
VLGSSLAIFMGFAALATITHAPVLGSLLLSAAAAYFPIFLGLIIIFTRSRLGPNIGSIYAKPVSPGAIVVAQLTTITLAAGLAVAVVMLMLLLITGHRVDLPELAGIALGAGVTAAAAYLCGSVVRVNPGDQLSILTAITGLFVIQTGSFALISALQLSNLGAAAVKLSLILMLGLAAAAVERFVHLGRMVRHA